MADKTRADFLTVIDDNEQVAIRTLAAAAVRGAAAVADLHMQQGLVRMKRQ